MKPHQARPWQQIAPQYDLQSHHSLQCTALHLQTCMKKMAHMWAANVRERWNFLYFSAHHSECEKQDGSVGPPTGEPLCMCEAGRGERKCVGQCAARIEGHVELERCDQSERDAYWPSKLHMHRPCKVGQSCDCYRCLQQQRK